MSRDQLSRDQLVTRSTCHKIHCHQVNSHEINSHEINSHEINLSRDLLNFLMFCFMGQEHHWASTEAFWSCFWSCWTRNNQHTTNLNCCHNVFYQQIFTLPNDASQVENTEVRKPKYRNRTTEVRGKTTYRCLVPYWLTNVCWGFVAKRWLNPCNVRAGC